MAKSINLAAYIHGENGICYTKSEVNSLLDAVDGSLEQKAALVHSHDDLYYTESEIDSIVSGIETAIGRKADATHNHDGVYSLVDHTHSGVYSPVGHQHSKSDIEDFSHRHEASAIDYDGNTTVASALGQLGTAVSNLQTANWDISILPALPDEGNAQLGKLYFIYDDGDNITGTNAFDEYIWTGTKFEKIGQRKIDLSNYVTDVDMSFVDGQLSISLTKGTNSFTF